jgi:hypothetical protein
VLIQSGLRTTDERRTSSKTPCVEKLPEGLNAPIVKPSTGAKIPLPLALSPSTPAAYAILVDPFHVAQ